MRRRRNRTLILTRLALIALTITLTALWGSTAWFRADYVIGPPSPRGTPSKQLALGLAQGAARFIRFGTLPVEPGLHYVPIEDPAIRQWWFRSISPPPGTLLHKRIILIPLWILPAFTATLAAVTLLGSRPPKPGHCKACHYDLRDVFNTSRCPSCGTLIPRPGHALSS